MNVMRNTLITILLLVVIAVILDLSGVTSLRKIIGMGELTSAAAEQDQKGESPAKDDSSNWAKQDKKDTGVELQYQDVQQILANIDVDRRKSLLDKEDNFRNFIQQEEGNLSVLQAAKVNKVDQDQNTVFLMQIAADRVLRESYISKLMTEKFPAEFPTDDQIKEFYEKNKDKFVLEERVHIWQIFLKIDEGMDKAAITALEKTAADIATRIRQGKLDFIKAAFQYSENHPSRENGGDMGLIKVSDLRPEIAKPLMALKVGELSQPVRSDTGIHILKRGAVIPRQDVSLEQVRGQLIVALKKQAQAQFRKAIYEQAGKTYPVDIDDKKIEEWRLRLRTQTP